MVERSGRASTIKAIDERCSACVFGHQLVVFVAGGNIADDGTETRWAYTEPRPIGQTRNCFGILQRIFSEPETFIYPVQDDSCINPGKFKVKPSPPSG